jgi:hypothetical protein
MQGFPSGRMRFTTSMNQTGMGAELVDVTAG